MDIDRPLAQSCPDFLHSEPTAGEVSEHVESNGKPRLLNKITSQPQSTAEHRGDELGLPLIPMIVVLEELDIALNDFWKWQNAPAPKCRCRGAGHPGNGRLIPFPLDRNAVQFLRGERTITGLTVTNAA